MNNGKFYIWVKSNDGNDCMVDYSNEPTWCLDNAMRFETRGDAALWIMAHGKEWIDSELEILEVEE